MIHENKAELLNLIQYSHDYMRTLGKEKNRVIENEIQIGRDGTARV